MKESAGGQVATTVKLVELIVEMAIEGHQVDLVGKVGLMVATAQVVLDD